jgi:hypothetical protein
MDSETKKKCENGYHYHPGHPKSDKNGCMKNEDMKESFGSLSIYNAVRCSSERRLNNTTLYIGI